MGSYELKYRRGRWLVPTELAGLLDEVYDTLLRQRPDAENIMLGCEDSDREIYCAIEPKRLTGRPFALTEEQAKEKLWMWRRKPVSTEHRRDTDAGCITTNPTDSVTTDSVNSDSATTDPITTDSVTTDSTTHDADPTIHNATRAPSADSSLQSKPIPTTTEVEQVRCLRARGYIIALPYTSPNGPQNIGPPPSYDEHVPMSMSQPLPGATKPTPTRTTLGEKRKRVDDWTAETTTPTITLTENPLRVRTRDANGGPGTSDGDTNEDDVVVVSAPLRKKHRTTRTKATVRNSLPQKPSTPPRRTKTKKTALSSVISYEEATDLTGMDVQASGVEGDDERDGAAAGEEYRDMEVGRGGCGEHNINSDRTAEPTETGLRGLRLADGPPLPSSPEEVVASSLLALRRSTPTAPITEAALDDGGDGLFVSQDTPTASKPTDTSSRDECATTRAADWSAEDRRLYRHFCEDVKTAEGQWDHASTRQGMAKLREQEPLLQPTFLKCLAIARRTMGEEVVYEWRNFQERGWEKRRRHGFGPERRDVNIVAPGGSLSTVEPARRDVVTEAYRQFKEAVGANTNSWKARFQYRRAAVGLAVQYEAYAKLRTGQFVYRPGAVQQDRSMLLRALFREMRLDWRDALPDSFTERQAKDQGYIYEWKAFNRTIQDGRRWNLFAGDLGLGALLLIDTSGNNEYIQRQAPIPVFVAWTKLISRIRLDVKEVAARVEGYYDGMEDPSFYAARKLRPLKLERRAYRACSPGEQFEFSGSEGRRTPTADPSHLTRPCDAPVYEGDYAMDDFIESSNLDDGDFPDSLVDGLVL